MILGWSRLTIMDGGDGNQLAFIKKLPFFFFYWDMLVLFVISGNQLVLGSLKD